MKYLIFLFSLTILISCSEDSNTDTNQNNGNNIITQAQLNAINKPCVHQNDPIILPSALLDISNYSSNDYTLELYTTVNDGNTFLQSFSSILFIPPTATIYKPDNTTILDGDIAYTWGVFPEKYVYKQSDDGYSVFLFTSESQLIGREIIYTTQSENCDDFKYTVYAAEDDGEKLKGDIEFYYHYIKAGTAINMRYGNDTYDKSNNAYWLKSFEDQSGELIRKNGDQVTLNMNWNKEGNGTYTAYENGAQIANGIFEF